MVKPQLKLNSLALFCGVPSGYAPKCLLLFAFLNFNQIKVTLFNFATCASHTHIYTYTETKRYENI